MENKIKHEVNNAHDKQNTGLHLMEHSDVASVHLSNGRQQNILDSRSLSTEHNSEKRFWFFFLISRTQQIHTQRICLKKKTFPRSLRKKLTSESFKLSSKYI